MNIFNFIQINPKHDTTIVQQLKHQISWLIINGKLQAGDQLPNIYEMAERFGINLHTVRSAYHKLEKNGLVETRPGRGTHVLSVDLFQLARLADTQPTNTIGVIIPTWSNPFYHAVLQGVEEVVEEDQSLLFLCNTHDDPQNAWREFARLSAKGVDGILVVSHNIDEVIFSSKPEDQSYEGPPYVTVDSPDTHGYSVNLDLESAGYQAAKHLISLGHKTIGLITFSVDAANVLPVNSGFFSALEEAGIPMEKDLVAKVPGFNMADGEAGAQKLLTLNKPPTAIFAISDTLAIGAMQAIKQAGLDIPADISVIGFNDIPLAQLVTPALTTIAAPSHELGRTAMQLLQKLIKKEEPEQKQITLPISLTLRQSCGYRNSQ
jgi:DNA-binding LacI/PurR family transcriptional regulator